MDCKLIFVFVFLGTFSAIFAELVSEGRIATQSSVGWGGDPEKGVDGFKATHYGYRTCTHTQKQAENWWMVDLGNSYAIGKVRIYNRADCCRERLNGATIHVGDDVKGMLTNAQCGESIADADTSAGSVIDRQCSPVLNGRYVSVSLPNNYLSLCEVEVFSLRLLSERRSTRQSSITWGGYPGRAVDGRSAINFNQNSCTHTSGKGDNWWQVDLGRTYSVGHVRIFNRADCCRERLNDATIHVGDDAKGMLTNAQCGEPITDADTKAGSVIDRQCNPVLNGRYVSVALKDSILTLCEVEVWGL
ncbi:uncharacterized protein LOC117113459 [Anneissia japonica]|uniref:uncharacterized protein LOC117113459 n=1 Tax=Anneissia japonica TaxID=1529436 RepID=UPI0014257379|nr:uncharacterized protein LOC117113459 [Anneissia japonica]